MGWFKWTLADAEERAAKHPKTFEIPTEAEREGVQPGQYAKLCFEDEDGGGERMWVLVTKRTADKDGIPRYEGTLANDPVAMPLRFGRRVKFKPRHILSIQEKGGGA